MGVAVDNFSPIHAASVDDAREVSHLVIIMMMIAMLLLMQKGEQFDDSSDQLLNPCWLARSGC